MRVVPEPSPEPRGEHGGAEPGSGELAGLLRGCARGDESQFAALYDATAARLYGLVRKVVRDPEQAQEVTQETYLQIWAQSARFDPGAGSALAWMMTIAHRRAVDRVRSAQARTDREVTYTTRAQGVPYDTTAEDAHRSLEAQRVRQGLDALTPVQREAVQLAYFGGYTHRQVAALLHLPEGTAKTRIRDGLIRLRDTMGAQR